MQLHDVINTVTNVGGFAWLVSAEKDRANNTVVWMVIVGFFLLAAADIERRAKSTGDVPAPATTTAPATGALKPVSFAVEP
jgi:hypothetical protein